MDTLNHNFLPMPFKIHAANHIYKIYKRSQKYGDCTHKTPFLGGGGKGSGKGANLDHTKFVRTYLKLKGA